jgi:hypothetical protein
MALSGRSLGTIPNIVLITGPALVKYDAGTCNVLETVDFEPNSCDPHGLAMHDGALTSCHAGIHPGWPVNDSPTAGWIFRIDFV